MLKIQKSRAMTRFVEANRLTGRHTGKTGYTATRPGPKPLPWGLAEEASSNFYPQYRKFVPTDYRKYTDSYYDLRNQQYKYWFDKWGKPHINKWWRTQKGASQKIHQAYEQVRRNVKYPTFSKFNGQYYSNKRPTNYIRGVKYCTCGNKHGYRQNGNRQSNRVRKRFSSRKNYRRYRYDSRWY